MLLTLPDELLVRILEGVSAADRNLRFLLVNRRLKSVIESSVVLQVLTECELASLTLGSLRHTSFTGVLASLGDRRETWRTLQGMDELTIPVCSEDEYIIPIFGRDCAIICQTSPNRELIFTQIPSRTKSIPFKPWSFSCGIDHVADAVADEQQNLLAVIEVLRDGSGCISTIEVRLLELTTGERHSASIGVISLPLPSSYSSREVSDSPASKTALAGDFIAIMLSVLRDGEHDDMICYLWACNWKTGEMKVEAWCGNDSEMSNAASFAFLSPEYILIARSNWPVQKVELVVVSTKGPLRRGTYGAIADTIFDLPPLEQGAACEHMAISEFGACSYPTFESQYTFTRVPESRIISVDLLYTGSRGVKYQFRLGIPVTHMLQCLHKAVMKEPEGPTESRNESQPWHVPWREWAEEVRWVPINQIWSIASYSPTAWLVQETRTPYELQGHRSPIPGHPPFMDVLVKYDFPSASQVQRDSKRPPPPTRHTKGPLTLIDTQYHHRQAVTGDDLWAFQVFSAPYRQTIFITDVARDIRRDLCYEITEDALILRDTCNPRSPWRIFSI